MSDSVALSEPVSNGAASEAPGSRVLSPEQAQTVLMSAQAMANSAPESEAANATEAAPAPKRRGRPPKNPVPVDGEAPTPRRRAASASASASASSAEGEEAPAPKKRGRPPKNAALLAAAGETSSATAASAGSFEVAETATPQPQVLVASPETTAAPAEASRDQLSLDVDAPRARFARPDERPDERPSDERGEPRERAPLDARGQNRPGERGFEPRGGDRNPERGENRSLRFRERPENRPEGRLEGRREGFAPNGSGTPGFVPPSGPNGGGAGWREEFGPNGTRLIGPASEGREAEPRPEARLENRPLENRAPEARPEGRPEGRLEPRPEARGFENRGRNGEGRGFEAREDNRGRNDNRNDNRNEPRGEGRGEGRGDGRNDRFGRDRNGRDGNRDGGRDGNRGEGRDGGRGQNDPRERGLDRIEREALRARPELETAALEALSLEDLRRIVGEMNEPNAENMGRDELVFRGLELQAQAAGMAFKRGLLEILGDGRGFLRTEGYLSSDGDVYVSSSQIKRFNLKTGDQVSGQARPPKGDERHHGLLRVESINGASPEEMKARKEFEKLTPIFPDDRFRLETSQENVTARIIDLVSPLGKGQRGLIVAPPKAGKTTLLKNIANSISRNHPEVEMIVLLIDERPEEVTDISRSVRGEVVASTFDETAENHMRVAEMVFEKAKRMVEQKKDVVVLLDSLTRLSRAANLVVAPSGRTMSGGLDPAAMHKPKKMFGAARNIEEGGSLTILATVLVDTGSRMDEYIFEEFKGTGNMDLVLDRNLFDQRVFPAIDINKSGTRRDDLLMTKEDLAATFHLRRTLAQLDNDKAITLLLDRLRNTKTNVDFMQIVARSASKGAVQQP